MYICIIYWSALRGIQKMPKVDTFQAPSLTPPPPIVLEAQPDITSQTAKRSKQIAHLGLVLGNILNCLPAPLLRNPPLLSHTHAPAFQSSSSSSQSKRSEHCMSLAQSLKTLIQKCWSPSSLSPALAITCRGKHPGAVQFWNQAKLYRRAYQT